MKIKIWCKNIKVKNTVNIFETSHKVEAISDVWYCLLGVNKLGSFKQWAGTLVPVAKWNYGDFGTRTENN